MALSIPILIAASVNALRSWSSFARFASSSANCSDKSCSSLYKPTQTISKMIGSEPDASCFRGRFQAMLAAPASPRPVVLHEGSLPSLSLQLRSSVSWAFINKRLELESLTFTSAWMPWPMASIIGISISSNGRSTWLSGIKEEEVVEEDLRHVQIASYTSFKLVRSFSFSTMTVASRCS